MTRTLAFAAILLLLPSLRLVGADDASAPRDRIKLALLRGVPEKWNLEKNFAVVRAAIPAAAAHGADLFVTPEGWLDGYASPDPKSTPARLRAVAQSLDDSAYLKEVAALAKQHGIWVCFGFISLEDGRIYNTAGLWDDNGQRVGVYHKTHLLDHDLQYSPGESLPAFASPWGPLGIIICADRRWPETVRVVRLHGTRLILNPSYGSHSNLNEAMMRTRAFENGCYIAFTHPEEGLVTGPDGEIVAKVEDTPEGDNAWDLLCVALDLSVVNDHGHLEHRRPDLYEPLAKR